MKNVKEKVSLNLKQELKPALTKKKLQKKAGSTRLEGVKKVKEKFILYLPSIRGVVS